MKNQGAYPVVAKAVANVGFLYLMSSREGKKDYWGSVSQWNKSFFLYPTPLQF